MLAARLDPCLWKKRLLLLLAFLNYERLPALLSLGLTRLSCFLKLTKFCELLTF